ncbi:MAG TPA: PKD domain-containing protein, partial [Planctomycetota bacterium]|nr:PKD domain-containing protein [Planctomycetota bacterium]
MDDGDPWISDATYAIQLPYPANAAGSPPAGTPVTRVGLIIKTWGASPDVTADFEYFCLQVLDTPPEAAITATPPSGTVPIDVELSAAGSVDPSGGTLTYKWDFGDGQTGEGLTVTHRYTTPGVVTVTLTATDDERNFGTATTQLYLSEDVSPLTFSKLGGLSRNGLVRIDRADPESPYCLHVGGNQLAFSADQAYFLQKELTGNFAVTAKVTAATFSNTRARAGLMARLNTDENSANVLMGIDSADDGYVLQVRAITPGATRRLGGPIAPPRGPVPAWLRLERQGGTFIGSYSNDGTTFVEYARENVPAMDVPGLLVGFAATSGQDNAPSDYCAVLDFGDEAPGAVFHRGDADDNGSLQLTDALRILGFLVLGGPPPTCLDAGDADDNGSLQLT